MNLKDFRFEVDADGVAIITWDTPNKPMNLVSYDMVSEIETMVEKVASDPAIKGAVITTAKELFSGGADLTMLQGSSAEFARVAKAEGEEAAMRGFTESIRRGNFIYRRLETCGKPFAAAIHGLALGGGFELALACQYRVASDDPKTKVGLPEIKVGLFPGAGGTQRVPRLMPTPDALQMLFKGDQIKPSRRKR